MALTGMKTHGGGLRRACFALSLAAACAASARAQTGRPVSVESGRSQGDPIKLIGVEVSGESHPLAESEPPNFAASFDAPEDWLRRVTFKIRNDSDKVVVCASFYGAISAAGSDEIPMGVEVRFGRELDESAFTGRPPRGEPRRLPPGQTADVNWTDSELASLEKFLSTRHAVADYRRMSIELREARFEDGTVWAGGGLYRIDPNDPRKWTPLDRMPARAARAPDLKPGERLLEVSTYQTPSDPEVLSIREIRVAGQAVAPGQPFAAGDGWLRNLTVRVRNISAKPVTYVRLNLTLPEARYHSGNLGIKLQYGREAVPPERPAPDAPRLMPGEEAELSFTDEQYETNLDFAQRMSGVTFFSRLRMNGAAVQFADGTRALISNVMRARKPDSAEKK